jgi:hypothetical protein
VVISGQGDVQRYARCIGFNHPEKRERLERLLSRGRDTNVDIVPIAGDALRDLRTRVGLSMKALAKLSGACSRPMISLIESGHRRPSRALLTRILTAIGRRCWQAMKGLCRAAMVADQQH